ncbi:MAG: prenyltransferase/squalene oxidase repeat-containing protein, partial [Planctomycetota bacterium JB042]
RAPKFLLASARDAGSGPLDTNRDTWTTTLAVKALAAGGAERPVDDARAAEIVRWLLDQQGAAEHPYTLAAPGAWAWTDLPGGVPDADDTPGALLALRILAPDAPAVRASAAAGVRWLVDLANRDGGVPTFCRGFGRLPFDRSSPDLTAHALRAWRAWRDDLDLPLRRQVDAARAAAVRYLVATQAADGSWTPLWFGNQRAPREESPLYGTAQVVLALLDETGDDDRARDATARAVRWIVAAQGDDGGFGGAPGTPPSIEETGVALSALAEARRREETAPLVPDRALSAAIDHLASATRGGEAFPAAPIGLYFARLWYAERLYPVLFTLGGLESASAAIGP